MNPRNGFRQCLFSGMICTLYQITDEKPLKGKTSEERSNRKLLLHVARAADSGKSTPFITTGNEAGPMETGARESSSNVSITDNNVKENQYLLTRQQIFHYDVTQTI
jgi:hypothetical protein